jgi:anti-sigma-K factor RskA
MSPADRDRLAGEYVLGVLDSDEQRQAERLLASDAAFQTAVASWQARFTELDQTATPISAGDALWRRIENGIALADAVEKPAASASDPTPVVVPDPRNAFRALWRSLPFWRGAGLAGAFATIALAVGLGFLADRSARQPVMVAVLLTDANRPAGVINTYRNGQAELVPFADMQIPQGRALEVWSIAGPNQTPVSVGVVTEPRTLNLNLQRVQNLAPNHTFAISVEPPQGSPTGLPTGPVLMHGTATTRL